MPSLLRLAFFLVPLLLSPLFLPAQERSSAEKSPYGVYADILRGQEHEFLPKNLERMREAGIDWVRWDFYWDTVESPQGTLNLERISKVLDQLEANGLESLVILGYTVPWARPACDHQDVWLQYVRKVVTAFKDRVHYWEIWNETNLKSFWVADPSPEGYAAFLKATYEMIKSIDPNACVLYGGLAGVPFDYYEKSLQAGAGPYFDAANVHPYRGGLTSPALIRNFIADLKHVQDLTVRYCGKPKPIWITEMGWSTPPALGRSTALLIDASLNRLYPNGVPGKIAVLFDPLYPPSSETSLEMWRKLLKNPAELEAVRIADLKTLDPTRFPALILPPSEAFPTAAQDEIRAYVWEGGTLMALGGIPFYYRMMPDANGNWSHSESGPATGLPLAHSFRVHWGAWWTEDGLPRQPKGVPAPGMEEALKDYPAETLTGQAFFSEQCLKEGDSLDPLLVYAEDASKVVAGIYRFRSDWKGNLILNSTNDPAIGGSNRTLELNQGIYLSQAMLLALTFGVERFFPYEFQAVERDEQDAEHHFGITHADLTPKPGYLAYRALTKARPAGSVPIPGELFRWNDQLCVLSWDRPDGQTGYAVWTPTPSPQAWKVQVKGQVTDVFDCHGEPVALLPKMIFGQKITYVIGKDLELEVTPAQPIR